MMSYWVLFIGIASKLVVQMNLQNKFKKYSKIRQETV